jgi:hypothetical protein
MREGRQFMFRYNPKTDRSRKEASAKSAKVTLWLRTGLLAAGMTLATIVHAADPARAPAEPFKFMNIHFETNASGCDMGIQILFDTDGVTEVSIEAPNDEVVFSSQTPAGMEDTHDQTEGFQERVEPPIVELEDALGCEPPDDAISLGELFAAWPAGEYEFEATSGGVDFEGEARLTHKIPAGPEITAPEDGTVVPAGKPLVIEWKKVTGPILPKLGPVRIVGYHLLLKNVSKESTGPLVPPAFDVDVPANVTSVVVPKAYFERGQVYEFEVLATDTGGNQTITEGGAICTAPIDPENCELP